jgi:hypothetical protein
MAQYLIVTDPNLGHRVEAKHIKEAMESMDLKDGESVIVYRLAGPPKRVTARVQQHWRIEVSDAGEDQ